MLEDFQGDSWGSIPPLRMSSLLPHDLCHGRSASRRPPTLGVVEILLKYHLLSETLIFSLKWCHTEFIISNICHTILILNTCLLTNLEFLLGEDSLFYYLFPLFLLKSESEVTQLCPTLCDPRGCSLLRSTIHGNLQARIPEWVAIPFSWESSQHRDQTWVSHTAADSLPFEPTGAPSIPPKIQ